MNRGRVDDFLATADAVLDDDWTVGPDAMRWTPAGQRNKEDQSDPAVIDETYTFDAGMDRLQAAMREAFEPAFRRLAEGLAQAGTTLHTERLRFADRPVCEHPLAATIAALEDAYGPTPPRPGDDITDPRERALHLRRTRNTGPQHLDRAPRRIDPRRGRT